VINFIQKYDPKFLALKRSIKTFLAILIALAIFYKDPRMAMFAAISSLLVSKSQTGITLKDRKFSMLITGVILALLSIPVSLISQFPVLSTIFITIAAFVTFFLIGLRVLPDFPAIVVLSVIAVEMAFSHSLNSGMQFAGLFLLCTALVFTIHFIVLPTRPRVRLKIQLELIYKSLDDYFLAITNNYNDFELAIAATQRSAAKVRQAITEYQRLWNLLGMKSHDLAINKSRFNEIAMAYENLFEYLLLIWQFRARTWDSEKFKAKILLKDEYHEVIRQLMNHYQPDLIKPSDLTKDRIQNQLQNLNKQYLAEYQQEKNKIAREEWVAVFNAIHALLALSENIDSTEKEVEVEEEITISKRIVDFVAGIKKSAVKMKFSNPAFRFGLRSSIIVGVTMAYSTFIAPAHGFWLVLFSILLIRPNLGVSVKAGRDRLIGTIAGCLLGFTFVHFCPAGSATFYIMILLSVFLMIWFTNLDNFILMVTALTFLIIALFSLIYPSDEGIALLRLIYTAGVVLFVIFISFLLWPEKARKKFAHSLASTIDYEKQYFISIMERILNNSTGNEVARLKKGLTTQLNKLDEIEDATKNEILQTKVIHHGLNITNYIYRLRNTLHSMDFAGSSCNSEVRFPEFENELRKFTQRAEEAFDSLTRALHELKRAEKFPNLRDYFLDVRNSFRAIRAKSNAEKDEITQLWNLSTFIWNLKPLILELEGIKTEIDLKMDER